ncbi:MAG: hypothetical protein IJS53_04200 [Clostridia bacterium]|nr:hypothetical protein [Clostridia bacterium]
MRCEQERRVYTASYPSRGSRVARAVGIVLIVSGVLVIVLCVPLWAWLALIGAAMIFVGTLLLQK